METTAVMSPDAESIARSEELSAGELLRFAATFTIASAEEYTIGADRLKAVKAREKLIEEQRTELVKPLNATVKRINDLFRRPLELYSQAGASIKQKMLAYQQEEERNRRAEQARLNELARKEEERLRKLAETKAVKAEAKGQIERAEEIRESVPLISAPQAAPVEVPKVAGISTRQIWKAEVNDLSALIKAVAAGEVPPEALLPNTAYLGQTARALKSAMRWPGVRVWAEETLAAGR